MIRSAYDLKRELTKILSEKEDKNFEADLIISHITKLEKSKWIFKDNIEKCQIKKCINLAKKRKKGVPIQYLIKNWEFFAIPIVVGKGVLIPRQDTELLVEICLKLIKKNYRILDLGTGSGCIAAAIAKNKKDVKIYAIEKYKKAIKYAKKNLSTFKEKIVLIKGDILNEKFAKKFQNIDLIVSNPPYLSEEDLKNMQKELEFEPKNALSGGKTGLKFYEKITSIWKDSLKSKGNIVFEIGSTQKQSVELILNENKFFEVTTYKDFEKKDRVVVGKKL